MGLGSVAGGVHQIGSPCCCHPHGGQWAAGWIMRDVIFLTRGMRACWQRDFLPPSVAERIERQGAGGGEGSSLRRRPSDDAGSGLGLGALMHGRERRQTDGAHAGARGGDDLEGRGGGDFLVNVDSMTSARSGPSHSSLLPRGAEASSDLIWRAPQGIRTVAQAMTMTVRCGNHGRPPPVCAVCCPSGSLAIFTTGRRGVQVVNATARLLLAHSLCSPTLVHEPQAGTHQLPS
jgi:hypothetical protein